VVIEKGGPYQTVTVGEVNRGIEVARRVRAHPEVPDRRGVARQQKQHPEQSGADGRAGGRAGTRVSTRINARSRRCAEPDIPDAPFIADISRPVDTQPHAPALGHAAARAG
jgi:hypothetical protein